MRHHLSKKSAAETGAAMCNQTMEQFLFSGNALRTLFNIPSIETGKYGFCENGLPDTHWCGLEYGYRCVMDNTGTVVDYPPGSGNGLRCLAAGAPALGLCVPQACTSRDLSDAVYNVTAYNALFQITHAGCVRSSVGEGDGISPSCNISAGHVYLQAICTEDNPRLIDDASAMTVLVVVGILIAMVLLATVVGLYERFAGFMAPHTDCDEHGPLLPSQDRNLQAGMEREATGDDEGQNTGATLALPRVPKSVMMVIGWFDITSALAELMQAAPRGVTKGPEKTLTGYMDGLRFVAMLFVIYGHTLYFPFASVGFDNPTDVGTFVTSYRAIVFGPAIMAVDVFFFLSGFLFMFLYVKNATRSNGPLKPQKILLMYAHRWLRLTPMVMVALAVATWLLPYFPTGPLSQVYGHSYLFTKCRKWWWHQLLYITNFHFKWIACMGWFWYLSCDMQLFIFAPLFGTVFMYNRHTCVALLAVGICIGTGLAAHRHPMGISGNGEA
jgi:hypothetical protein